MFKLCTPRTRLLNIEKYNTDEIALFDNTLPANTVQDTIILDSST